MDTIELLKTFREVVHSGNFASAARALDLSPASVSKYVVALERHYGVRLFNRTTRKVSLTDAGLLLYERLGSMLGLLEMTENDLRDRANEPSGRLVVSAPHMLMHVPMTKTLGRFLTRYPRVSLNLLLTNHRVNLAGDGVDVALSVGRIPDANIIVRRLMHIRFVVAATPAYWRKHGRPAHPRELAGHHTLSASQYNEAPRWEFVDEGQRIEFALEPHVDATDGAPLPLLALMDLGVVYLPSLTMVEHLTSGALEPVLQSFVPTDYWLFAAYAQRHHNAAALTSLLDFLERQMGPLTLPEQAVGAGMPSGG
jgi:DNA-binding transcriptional LysR family regulator